MNDYIKIVAEWANFTMKSSMEPDGNWGASPKPGTLENDTDRWTGVLGAVSKGHYDMGVTAWFWTYERINALSFVPVVIYRPV